LQANSDQSLTNHLRVVLHPAAQFAQHIHPGVSQRNVDVGRHGRYGDQQLRDDFRFAAECCA